MEKLNRNFQREISNLSYSTECFCVDPNPHIFVSFFITAEVDIERHDKAYYMFICLIRIKIVTRERKNRDSRVFYSDSANFIFIIHILKCNHLIPLTSLDSMITSPHRRSPSFRKKFPRDELGSWSALLQRHHFLLTALALLAFLCTIYLYFAVTLGATESCSGLTGAKKTLCRLELAKDFVGNGKLNFFLHG
ncbi:uncharacterized protein LOC133682505 [Populus nigra]|uniref:uncharacterized protein LOC133682505 n=1 Tax=Populus nigra TaxID=3691 RepID=UPI002B2699F0|nr:uncharacterized protein LOC133682505 [Populus nigra]